MTVAAPISSDSAPEASPAPAAGPNALNICKFPRAFDIAVWALVGFGGVLRVGRWFAGRSLWYDEILLASNIASRSMRDLLLKKLDSWQAAPAGYLFLEKIAADCFGSGERGLRVVALLCGLASLLVFRAVALRLMDLHVLDRAGALLAIALFACAGPYVYYSSEVKQYSGDVLAATALLLAGIAALQALQLEQWRSPGGPSAWRALAPLGAIGSVAMFFSHPAMFVMAGVWCVVTFLAWRAGRRDWIAALGWIAGAWSLLLAVNYLLFLRLDTDADIGAGLVRTWELLGGFPPREISPWPGWLWAALEGIFGGYATLWIVHTDLAVAIALIGAAAAWNIDRRCFALLLAPFVVTLLAATARKYPFADRLILFLTPVAVLLLGAGLGALVRGAGSLRIVCALVLAGMLLGPSAQRAIGFLLVPPGREETKPVLIYIANHAQPGDILLCCDGAHPAYRYYKTISGVDRLPVVWAPSDVSGVLGAEATLAPLHGRVWLFFTHVWNAQGVDESSMFKQAADHLGKRLDSNAGTGAQAYLYQFP